MTNVLEEVNQAAQDVAPTAPITEIVGALAATVAQPTNPAVIIEDLILVHGLVTQVQAALAGKPASLMNIFTALFHSI